MCVRTEDEQELQNTLQQVAFRDKLAILSHFDLTLLQTNLLLQDFSAVEGICVAEHCLRAHPDEQLFHKACRMYIRMKQEDRRRIDQRLQHVLDALDMLK
jgi:hypothetical protein